jgi:gliding motility-associated-like protein
LTITPGGTVVNGTGTTYSWPLLGDNETYTFIVTDENGCPSLSTLDAVVNPQPQTPLVPVIENIIQPTCDVATGSVEFSNLPATGDWTLTTDPDGLTFTSNGTTGTFSGLPESSSFTFIVTNADGCTSASTGLVAINAQPVTPSAPLVGTITQPTCLLPTGSVELLNLPTGNWILTSTPGGLTQNNTGATTTFTGLTPDDTYTFTVTNDEGCTSEASLPVDIEPIPNAPLAPTIANIIQPTCPTPTGTIEVAVPLGAQYTYSIDGTTFQAGTIFSGLAPGSYTITVLDNTSGCSSVSVSTITVDPVTNAPLVTLISSTSVTCNGDTDGQLEISISGGQLPYTITWDPNVGNGTTVDNLAAGFYTVNVTDNNGCSTSETFTVSAPNGLLVNGTSTDVLCGIADGTITTSVAGGTAPYTYSWTPNGETSTSLTGLAAGTYSVVVTDDNGCTASQNFTLITVGNLPIDIDTPFVEIEGGESVVLTATGGENYIWTPSTGLSCSNCPNPTATPTETTIYYVSASDANGCVGGDSSIVVIKIACGDLFVPNIFSPNSDGNNDFLCIYGGCIESLEFAIYSRWGEIVFETTDPNECWNGTYKGKPMNSETFVYKMIVKLAGETEEIFQSGNINLVR